jgi:hypothetical protein
MIDKPQCLKLKSWRLTPIAGGIAMSGLLKALNGLAVKPHWQGYTRDESKLVG